MVPNATGRPATKPEAVWSPDSKKLLTAQVDDRQVLEMPVINFAPPDGSVRPTAFSVRAALPGDAHVTQFRMLVIDIETKKQVAAHYPTLPAARMNDSPLGGNRVWWAADGRLAYFVEIERGPCFLIKTAIVHGERNLIGQRTQQEHLLRAIAVRLITIDAQNAQQRISPAKRQKHCSPGPVLK